MSDKINPLKLSFRKIANLIAKNILGWKLSSSGLSWTNKDENSTFTSIEVDKFNPESDYNHLMLAIEKIAAWRHDNAHPSELKENEVLIERFEIERDKIVIEPFKNKKGHWINIFIFHVYDPINLDIISNCSSFQEMIYKAVVDFADFLENDFPAEK